MFNDFNTLESSFKHRTPYVYKISITNSYNDGRRKTPSAAFSENLSRTAGTISKSYLSIPGLSGNPSSRTHFETNSPRFTPSIIKESASGCRPTDRICYNSQHSMTHIRPFHGAPGPGQLPDHVLVSFPRLLTSGDSRGALFILVFVVYSF